MITDYSRRHNPSLTTPKNGLNIHVGLLFVSSLRQTIICLAVSLSGGQYMPTCSFRTWNCNTLNRFYFHQGLQNINLTFYSWRDCESSCCCRLSLCCLHCAYKIRRTVLTTRDGSCLFPASHQEEEHRICLPAGLHLYLHCLPTWTTWKFCQKAEGSWSDHCRTQRLAKNLRKVRGLESKKDR